MSETSEMLSRLIAKQEEARAARESLKDKRAAIVQLAKDEGRDDLTESEDEEFRSLSDSIKATDEEIIARDARIAELADEEKRAENADKAFRRAVGVGAQVRVTKEAVTYERGNGRSYFRDMALAHPGINNDRDAQIRLERHAQEMEMEARTNPNRTDGQGGHYEVAAA